MTRAAPDFAEPCLRKVLRVSGGRRWVAARIHRTCHCTIHGGDDSTPHPWRESCDRYPHLVAEIDGEPASIERVWTARREIKQHEFDYLTAVSRHIEEHEPDAYDADPYKPIDWNTLPPPSF